MEYTKLYFFVHSPRRFRYHVNSEQLDMENCVMNISLIKVFVFVLVLIGVMAGVAFIMSHRQGRGLGNTFVESIIWGGSLLACAGGDYLLVVLNSNHAWA